MRPKHYDVALFLKSYSKTKSTAMPRQELELLLNFRVRFQLFPNIRFYRYQHVLKRLISVTLMCYQQL